MRNFLIIVWTVWIEYLRRKDFYVVLILTSLFALLSLGVRVIGVRTADEAYFLMSFGLTLAYLLAGFLTIVLASRQIPREFEHRTLYPLLARPLTRFTFLAGKIAGVAVLGIGSLLLLTLLVYLPTPKSAEQSVVTLGQVLVIQMLAMSLLATFACGLSLVLPSVLTSLVTTGLFVAGGGALRALHFGVREFPPVLRVPIEGLLKAIPDFSIFDHIPRFVEGASPFQAGELLILVGYGVVLTALYLALGAFALSRKQF
jgi:ABC-type transport system involved in multi-copper enzyme maturation permease subunit